MSAILHLAGMSDFGRLEPMVEACHAEAGLESDLDFREAALGPLLEGSPLGAAWLVGPKMSPVGYLLVSFGWRVADGGMVGVIDEFWIRPKVRGRGMGTEVLTQLLPTLRDAGLKALSVEIGPEEERARRLAVRRGFRLREGTRLLTWRG